MILGFLLRPTRLTLKSPYGHLAYPFLSTQYDNKHFWGRSHLIFVVVRDSLNLLCQIPCLVFLNFPDESLSQLSIALSSVEMETVFAHLKANGLFKP